MFTDAHAATDLSCRSPVANLFRPRHEGRMLGKPTFIVQSFETKRGRLVPATKDAASTQGGALKRAEALAGRIPGAAALCIVVDDETGELRTATSLGTFGQAPDDFAESALDG